MDDVAEPLGRLVSIWSDKLVAARKYADEHFFKYARECMQFFSGDHFERYRNKQKFDGQASHQPAADYPVPTFEVQQPKANEMVALFGPNLYFRNPIRLVKPRDLPQFDMSAFTPETMMLYEGIMMDMRERRAVQELRAKIINVILDYTPREFNLKRHSRLGIDEALLKGMGLSWCEMYTPPGSQMRLPGSFFDSVDNFLMDPDMASLWDCKWISRRRTAPYWELAAKFPGTDEEKLRSLCIAESSEQRATMNTSANGAYDRARGVTNDLVVWYEVYSKMGMGGLLQGADPAYKDAFVEVGQYVYLCVCPGYPNFLNLPPEMLDLQSNPEGAGAIAKTLEWPIPFWADNDWPVSPLIFRPHPERAWPLSHLKPALGMIEFLDWVATTLINKVRTTSRDFLVVLEEAKNEIKKQIEEGKDLTIIELKGTQHKTIQELCQFLQHPTMNKDILEVYAMIDRAFEKATGMNEMMYGAPSGDQNQLRSATEAQIRGDQMRIRPDDMADIVEDWEAAKARKEAMALRWLCKPEDVEPVFGPQMASLFQNLVMSSSIDEVTRELDYTIEAGSARKPNLERDQSRMAEVMQNVLPVVAGMGAMNVVEQILTDWALTAGFDPAKYKLLLPPPPPVGPDGKPLPPEANQPPPPGAV